MTKIDEQASTATAAAETATSAAAERRDGGGQQEPGDRRRSAERPDERNGGPRAVADLAALVDLAKVAGRGLAALAGTERSALLEGLAAALEDPARRAAVEAANAADVAAAQEARARGEIAAALVDRLALDASKLASLADGLRQLAARPDLVGRVLERRELDAGLVLERVSAPLGVVAVVFESRPDALVQIAGLAWKSGNAVVLKGGREARRTNRALAALAQEVLAAHGVDPRAVLLLEERAEVEALLGLAGKVDLVVARGSSGFVRHVRETSRIPVMAHADGICHLVLGAAADPAMAARLAVDAKTSYPAACNSIETLLWEPAAAAALDASVAALAAAGVELRACPATRERHPSLAAATDADWDTEYGAAVLSIRRVADLDAALAHVAAHGSRHTEAIVTADPAAAARFLAEVDAACVFHDASTRFADGYRFGLGAEVGISTDKLHARGPVGVEGLLTYRWLLRGHGEASTDYGPGGRSFTHRDLPIAGLTGHRPPVYSARPGGAPPPPGPEPPPGARGLTILETTLRPDAEPFAHRAEHWRRAMEEIRRQEEEIREGGGAKAQEKQRSRGKMTARERVAALCDPDAPFLELGLWTAHGFYEEWGGAPAAGVVVGVGRIEGREAVVVANDATVKAGAWFPLTAKKVLRAQEIALENRLPIVYLVDSAGVFLPLQDEIFPDKEHFGRAFYNNARLSAEGVFQLAAIMGSCVAGGAYLPIMSDESHIVEGTGSIFLAGPHLVSAAIGERVDEEALGGAVVQADISGVVDHRHPDDATCLATLRRQMAQLATPEKAPFARREPRDPLHPPDELYGLMPVDRSRPYETRDLLARILDAGEFDEFKAPYGPTLVCGTGWIGGHAVGIVANQRAIAAQKTGLEAAQRELQIGGVLYSQSADKGARFVELCNQKKVPLLFVQDVTGFMVGTRAERGGIIKDGAKMVNAVANSTVPKITLFTGNSYGAGNYAMCGKAYGARFLYAWPSAAISVMGGEQASKTLLAIQLKNRGDGVSEEEKQQLLSEIQARYTAAMDPRYAAARLWVDAIIDPAETRDVLARTLDLVAHNPRLAEFKTGVLQT